MRTTVSLLPLAALLLIGSYGNAQTAAPELLLTWRAQSYVPPAYSGRALPGTNSLMSATVALIENGRVASLAGETVNWYVNGNFLDGGTGKNRVSFRAPGVAPNEFDLRAELPDRPEEVAKFIRIPLVRPEVVLAAPYPNARFSGRSAAVRAWPFFFGVRDANALTYRWTVDGESVEDSEDPQTLTMNIPPETAAGSLFWIGLAVENPARFAEFAEQSVALTFGQ